MKLLFRQRFFSWLDSYDIFDESEQTVYKVEGRLSFGHCLDITDPAGNSIGRVKEELFTLLSRFSLYEQGEYMGEIRRRFSLFTPVFEVDCRGWQVDGDFLQLDYTITDQGGAEVAHIYKELLHFTDTYVLEIADPRDALLVVMVVLAIDAAKCSDSK